MQGFDFCLLKVFVFQYILSIINKKKYPRYWIFFFEQADFINFFFNERYKQIMKNVPNQLYLWIKFRLKSENLQFFNDWQKSIWKKLVIGYKPTMNMEKEEKNDGTTSKITTQWSDKIPVKCRNENQLQKNVKPSYLSLFGRIYQWYCNDFR